MSTKPSSANAHNPQASHTARPPARKRATKKTKAQPNIPPVATPSAISAEKQLTEVLEKYWGYQSFRPLQLEAMQAVIDDQDSLVIFPTGGGKSLCFQAPAVCKAGLAVVVSPLISLMKDQVDALVACGIRAAFLNSSMSASAESEVLKQIRTGDLQIVYMAPERLLTERTHELLGSTNVTLFAIDEAHCVSEWGHDFRPEYRGLSVLKQKYPGVAVHAYTATATEQVRGDIVKQLNLTNPQSLIGSMDRPNLNYQLRRRDSGLDQILEVLDDHRDESGIIYCLSKKKVDSTAASLNALGHSALPYHAGLSAEVRKNNQDAFLSEEVNIIVATVAFGMGIDKSNVRFVIHATMPKSLEAYQQESGRAGRDGLESDCWMFHSGADVMAWKRLIEHNESSAGRAAGMTALNAMACFCNGNQCRHIALAAHFGEQLPVADCGACDVCLNSSPLELVEDPLVLGQKIISCVYRVDQRFGAEYVTQVLTGSSDQRVLANGHDKVSTYGLLKTEDRKSIRTWIDQLLSQEFLIKAGEYNVLNITDKGNQLLRGQLSPQLTKPFQAASSGSKASKSASPTSWEGVDKDLFEKLRLQRGELAQSRAVPAYVVFSDHSLREMSRRRPATLDTLRMINGIGSKKLTDFGVQFLEIINSHCQAANVQQEIVPPISQTYQPKSAKAPSASAIGAFPFFDAGLPIAEIAAKINRAESTTLGYLTEYLRHHGITDASRWVDAATIEKIKAAAAEVGMDGLKPLFVALNESVPYDQIRIVLTCLTNQNPETT